MGLPHIRQDNTDMTVGSYTERFPPSHKKHAAEAHGVVFLPAAGNRNGTSLNNVGSNGYYWSSSYNNSSSAYYLGFDSGIVNPLNSDVRCYGFSVRLVSDVAPN